MATTRYTYTMRDERLMWEYIFERLQVRDECALQPKGLRLWRDFEATGKTNKKPWSLATHFRRAMYDRIEEAKIPVEHQLYIANQLKMQLSKKQQRIIECKANISIIVDSFGVVTKYRKQGIHYDPSMLKKENLNEDDSKNDELFYDALNLSDFPSKVPKLSLSTEISSPESSTPHDVRQNIKTEENMPVKRRYLRRSLAVKTITIEDDSRHDESQNEDQKDFKGERVSQSNEFSGKAMDRNRKRTTRRGGLCGKLGQSNVAARRSENECLEIVEDRTADQQAAVCGNRDRLKKAWGKGHGADAIWSSLKISTGMKKNGRVPEIDAFVEAELKELLDVVENKRQYRGVEKLKTKKILEVRAEEAKRRGVGLRNYLKDIQRRENRTDSQLSTIV